MFDWLKEIVGESYTDEMDKAVAAEIGKHFVSRSDFNDKNGELKAARETIQTLQDAAAQYEGVDVAGLKQQLEDAQSQYSKNLAAVKLDSAIDLALAGASVRNGKAARAMLDMGNVTLDESGNLQGLADQLTALQGSDPWLFAAAEPVKTGAEHGTPLEPAVDGVTAAFLRNNPGLKI